jgi:hypothetical protein
MSNDERMTKPERGGDYGIGVSITDTPLLALPGAPEPIGEKSALVERDGL